MTTKVSKEELIVLLCMTNASEVTILSRSEAKMNKTNNPFYHKEGRAWVADHVVEKESKVVYDFGGSYEERVNEALSEHGKDSSFNSGGLSWGSFVNGGEGRVIEYNGTYYVRCYLNKNNKSEVRYFVDGVEATSEQERQIKDFTPTRGGSSKQANEGLSEGEQIIPNNISFDKILTIEIDGTEYEIA